VKGREISLGQVKGGRVGEGTDLTILFGIPREEREERISERGGPY